MLFNRDGNNERKEKSGYFKTDKGVNLKMLLVALFIKIFYCPKISNLLKYETLKPHI